MRHSMKIEKEYKMNQSHTSKIKTRILDCLILLSCCALLLCVGIQIVSNDSDMPELTILENRLYFGEIPGGIPTTKFVDIKNSGGQNLIIQSVRTGCGCIELKPTSRLKAAGSCIVG